jgi:hypothetical protein
MPAVALEDPKADSAASVVVQGKQPLSHQAVQPGQPTLAVAAAVLSTITVERRELVVLAVQAS